MKKEEKAKRPASKQPRQKNETVHERVRRHLSDKNSVITDDDIKNVKTELSIRADLPLEKQRDQEE
jgi:hypothetical protein